MCVGEIFSAIGLFWRRRIKRYRFIFGGGELSAIGSFLAAEN
jgi:hypothetical protein